jgi:hypothetical protein
MPLFKCGCGIMTTYGSTCVLCSRELDDSEEEQTDILDLLEPDEADKWIKKREAEFQRTHSKSPSKPQDK